MIGRRNLIKGLLAGIAALVAKPVLTQPDVFDLGGTVHFEPLIPLPPDFIVVKSMDGHTLYWTVLPKPVEGFTPIWRYVGDGEEDSERIDCGYLPSSSWVQEEEK